MMYRKEARVALLRKFSALLLPRFAAAIGVFAIILSVSQLAGLSAAALSNDSVTQVSAAGDATCAIKNYKPYCWGENGYGQLGNYSYDNQQRPTTIDAAISHGYTEEGFCHGIAWDLSFMGMGKGCLGFSPPSSYNLGDLIRWVVTGAFADGWSDEHYVDISGSAFGGKYDKLNFTKISTSGDHTCAIANAKVYCWGNNDHGQLGNNTDADYYVDPWASSVINRPVAVDTAKYDEQIQGHCSNPKFSQDQCWGFDSFSPDSLWSGNTSDIVNMWWDGFTLHHQDTVLKNKEIVDVATGKDFSCALASDGTLACWGSDEYGQLGDGSPDDAGNSGAQSGTGGSGRDGNGTEFDDSVNGYSMVPVDVTGRGDLAGKRVIKLAEAKGNTMCVIAVNASQPIGSQNSGEAYCWGYGMGAVTDGKTVHTKRNTSDKVNKNSCSARHSDTTGNVPDISADADLPVRYATDGNMLLSILVDTKARGVTNSATNKVYEWGGNKLSGTKRVKTDTTCGGKAGGNGLDSGGSKCGGGKNHGSAGCVEKVIRLTVTETWTKYVGNSNPARPNNSYSGRSLTGIGSGNGYFCAFDTSSRIFCDAGGTNASDGRIGNGSTAASQSGLLTVSINGSVLNGKTMTGISTSSSGHSCAIGGGSLACWGNNSVGQLGNNSTSNKSTPQGVSW